MRTTLSASAQPRRWRGRAILFTSLCLGLAIAVAQEISSFVGADNAWAGSREREVGQSRAQTQQSAEQTQQVTQPSGVQSRQSAERSQGDDQPQGSPTSQRDQASKDDRGSSSDASGAEKSATQPSLRSRGERDGNNGNKKNQDDDGPPKTVLEMIQRLTAPSQKGRVGQSGALPTLASSEILAARLSPEGRAKARSLGFKIGPPQHAGVRSLVLPPGFDAVSAFDLLRTQLPGERFGLNYVYRPYRSATGEGDDPATRARGVRKSSIGGCDADRCYGPGVIGWQPYLRSCAKNVRIGVIDTSIDRDHPAFSGRAIEMGNFLPVGAARVINWHGTGVLSVLAGSPTSGTPGLVPDAHFFAADVYHADESGQPVTDTASLLGAMDWMERSQVDLINMSMSGPRDELLENAIAEMSAKGVLFVAAAGNGGPNAPPSYPAAYDRVIAVTAVDKNLRGYIQANHGDYIDLAAPGVGIWTALPGALEGYQSGTSFAAPHVTAILAAVHDRVQDKSKEGFLRAVAVRDLGQVGRDRIYGRGLVIAPNKCASGEEPNGWVTDVVHAPATPLPPIPSSLTSSFR